METARASENPPQWELEGDFYEGKDGLTFEGLDFV